MQRLFGSIQLSCNLHSKCRGISPTWNSLVKSRRTLRRHSPMICLRILSRRKMHIMILNNSSIVMFYRSSHSRQLSYHSSNDQWSNQLTNKRTHFSLALHIWMHNYFQVDLFLSIDRHSFSYRELSIKDNALNYFIQLYYDYAFHVAVEDLFEAAGKLFFTPSFSLEISLLWVREISFLIFFCELHLIAYKRATLPHSPPVPSFLFLSPKPWD